jgi:Spx/MgsR family transcriptional regulator
MHGISNCDTIKKAKKWLTDAGIDFSFRDYKKHPVTVIELQDWALQVGWEVLLNMRGTTWRKLSAAQQSTVNETTVLKLLCDNPSMIKRPLLVVQGDTEIQAFVGFKPQQYATIFKL